LGAGALNTPEPGDDDVGPLAQALISSTVSRLEVVRQCALEDSIDIESALVVL
jgi:hypothetical protein